MVKTVESSDANFFGIHKPLTEFYNLPGINSHLDWQYKILHGALLGYVKYLWKATLEDKEF